LQRGHKFIPEVSFISSGESGISGNFVIVTCSSFVSGILTDYSISLALQKRKENIVSKSYISHLECSITGKTSYAAGSVHGLSEAGRPLMARYDLNALKEQADRDEIWARPGGFWKWRELLPVQNSENVISLGEKSTPILACPKTAALVGHQGELMVKDEGRLPTASFKARGLGVAVSMARELGLNRLAMPTNGNAGSALAAYASRAGMETFIFCPEETPLINVTETSLQGGKIWRVNGMIDDCGKIVAAGKDTMGWFDLSTLKEPYRLEGKKTLGLELAAQYGWQLPDVIFFPTGGGTAVVGMWKAFDEMEALGWIGSKRPKMIVVQSSGCAPLARAYDAGEKHAVRWENAATAASGIRVPQAVGDFIVLNIARQSGGRVVAVDDGELMELWGDACRLEGMLLCPEGAAALLALKNGAREGWIAPDDKVLVVNSGNGLKYEMPDTAGALDISKPIDFDALT